MRVPWVDGRQVAERSHRGDPGQPERDRLLARGVGRGSVLFDAAFHGSTGGLKLNKPVVGIGIDRVTGGYWLVASDGGVFAFDAPFDGSAAKFTSMSRSWGSVAGFGRERLSTGGRDGGVFDFDAPFYGSTGGVHSQAGLRRYERQLLRRVLVRGLRRRSVHLQPTEKDAVLRFRSVRALEATDLTS